MLLNLVCLAALISKKCLEQNIPRNSVFTSSLFQAMHRHMFKLILGIYKVKCFLKQYQAVVYIEWQCFLSNALRTDYLDKNSYTERHERFGPMILQEIDFEKKHNKIQNLIINLYRYSRRRWHYCN